MKEVMHHRDCDRKFDKDSLCEQYNCFGGPSGKYIRGWPKVRVTYDPEPEPKEDPRLTSHKADWEGRGFMTGLRTTSGGHNHHGWGWSILNESEDTCAHCQFWPECKLASNTQPKPDIPPKPILSGKPFPTVNAVLKSYGLGSVPPPDHDPDKLVSIINQAYQPVIGNWFNRQAADPLYSYIGQNYPNPGGSHIVHINDILNGQVEGAPDLTPYKVPHSDRYDIPGHVLTNLLYALEDKIRGHLREEDKEKAFTVARRKDALGSATGVVAAAGIGTNEIVPLAREFEAYLDPTDVETPFFDRTDLDLDPDLDDGDYEDDD